MGTIRGIGGADSHPPCGVLTVGDGAHDVPFPRIPPGSIYGVEGTPCGFNFRVPHGTFWGVEAPPPTVAFFVGALQIGRAHL